MLLLPKHEVLSGYSMMHIRMVSGVFWGAIATKRVNKSHIKFKGQVLLKSRTAQVFRPLCFPNS